MKQIKRNKKHSSRMNDSDWLFIRLFTFFFGNSLLILMLLPRPETTLGSPELVNQYSLNYEQSQISNEENSEDIILLKEEEENVTIEVTIEEENDIEEELAADEEEVYQPIGIQYDLPYYASYNGFKSYMSYRAICLNGSNELYLQRNYAITDENGLRTINNRYCVAMGTYFNLSIGQYFDLVLANGTVIPCIMSDTKSDKHTDSNNVYTVHSNCCSEFIVDTNYLSQNVKNRGNISYVFEEWNSPVVSVIAYEKNILID